MTLLFSPLLDTLPHEFDTSPLDAEARFASIRAMKLIRVLPLLVLVLSLTAGAIAGMTDDDREHLLVHFQMTTQMVAEQVRGLSPAQLEYRASPDRWTIRECVFHLAVA